VLEGLLVAVVSMLCAAWALKLWRGDLALPLRYTAVDDSKFYLMLVKGIIDHGWYASNSTLGAPFGQQLYDYPQGADNLSLLIVRGLAVFSSNPALVVNLFYLLTFALASVTCHYVLRALGVRAPVAGVTSVLFSLLTYHFFRGESHLLLSAYFAVPLSAYLFLGLLGDTAVFARRAPPHPPGLAWISRRSVATVGLCVVIGSGNLYYASFALVLLVTATLIAAVRRQRRTALQGLLIVALVTVTVAVNLAPSLAYRAEHGTNRAVERSAVADANTDEAFALSPLNLVVPEPQSRIAPLRRIAARYDHAVAPRYCESCFASLGTIGSIGFGTLGAGAIAALLGAGGWLTRRRLLAHASLGVAIALAAGAVGGVGSAIEVFLTPDIRAWNRISVVIAFFSLLAVAVLLDALIGGLRPRRAGAPLAAGLLGAVLAFGVYDQTTDAFVPPYSATARQWHSDGVFVAEIEARLPRGASLFQLPYVPFPEGYPQTRPGDQVATYATKYQLLRGYLHSSTLRWSYGAMKGRAGDWAAQLAGQPLAMVLASAVAAGFDGLWVDPAGFEPAKGARVLSAARSLLRVEPLESPDRDLWFMDLRPYRARLERTHSAAQIALLRERTLHPLRAACASGGLELSNPSPAPVTADLTVHLAAAGTLSRHVVLEPGSSVLRLPRAIRYATVTDDALAPFARGAGGSVVPGLTGPPCPH
jgi:phosphoglycerol transferase